jgi:hypothetical protein
MLRSPLQLEVVAEDGAAKEIGDFRACLSAQAGRIEGSAAVNSGVLDNTPR